MAEKNKTIFILREPNMDIPEGYLRKVLATCPSGGGYAIQTKLPTGEPTLETDHLDVGPSLKDVQDLLTAYSSHRVLLAFHKFEVTKEDFLQPFNVAIDGDDTLLSFAIDGHFPSMVEAGTTEESLLAQRVMFPNLQKLIKFSAGDLDKFTAELRDPAFVEMVMSRIGDRGAFMFLPPTGEGIPLGKNKVGSTFPWGQTSDTLGHTEVPASSKVTPATDVKKGWWGKSKGPEVPVAKAEVTAPAAEPAAPPPVPLKVDAPQPDTKVTPPEVTPSAPPKDAPPGHWETVQKGLSNDNRKKFIRRVTNCGAVLPDNWKQDPFHYWVTDYPKDERLIALAKERAAEPKDMRAAAPRPAAPKSGNEIDVLIMSKDEMTAIETHILQIMNRSVKEAREPLAIQQLEANYPKFSDNFGVKFELFNKWTPKELRLLGPKGLIHYALQARRRLIEIEAAMGGTTTEVPASVTASEPVTKKGHWGKPKAA